MTFNEAGLERLFEYLRKNGHWNIAEAFRDALGIAAALQAEKKNRLRSLTPDEEAFVSLMRNFPDQVGDYFGVRS